MKKRLADTIAEETIEEFGYSVEDWETGKVPDEEIEEIRKSIDFRISASVIGVFPAPDPDDIPEDFHR